MFSWGTWMEHCLKFGQAIAEYTNPATVTTFIATLPKTNINIKERAIPDKRARPAACNFTKKWIPFEAHFKDFCQKNLFFKKYLQMALSKAL